ncbi:hypothetical protein OROMI_029712 [Orobanche minor]
MPPLAAGWRSVAAVRRHGLGKVTGAGAFPPIWWLPTWPNATPAASLDSHIKSPFSGMAPSRTPPMKTTRMPPAAFCCPLLPAVTFQADQLLPGPRASAEDVSLLGGALMLR